MRILQTGLVAACALALSVDAFGAGDDFPGRLVRLARAGSHRAEAGDLVVIVLASNPSTGPANPAAKLKVEVRGEGLAKKAIVVFAPPARPLPGAPGEIQAYLPAEGEGDATVIVTPIDGKGEAGQPIEYRVKVSATR